EVCDGKDNDCNGQIDDGFGYPDYALDARNCGACGSVRNLPGAVSKCVPRPTDGGPGRGICAVDHCVNDGQDTYRHRNSAPGAPTPTGCEHHSPPPPTPQPPAPRHRDSPACQSPAETCNGEDDDCDFQADDNLADVGGPCGERCPGGDVARCIGECRAGVY